MMSHRTLPALFAAATWTTVALAGSPGTSAEPSPSTMVASEVIAGHYVAAILAADNALAREPGNPWLHYNRATALGHLLRTDEAVAAFDRADALFNSEQNVWGRSISMYGKGLTRLPGLRCFRADLRRGERRASPKTRACLRRSRRTRGPPRDDSAGQATRHRRRPKIKTHAQTREAQIEPRRFHRKTEDRKFFWGEKKPKNPS